MPTDVLQQIKQLIAVFGLKIISAIAIFLVGLWVSRFLRKFTKRFMNKSHLDVTLVSFVGNLAYAIALIFTILAALGQVGIETTSLIAVLGAAGLAVGLALQGSLTNFAAGILMIVFRPFRVGDWIEANGVNGIVEEIQVLTTAIVTLNGVQIVIPNGKLIDGNIVNYTHKPARRIDLIIGIDYSEDSDRVKQVIRDALADDPRILAEPALTVGILELGEEIVRFAVRPWVTPAHYWPVYFDTNERIKKALDAAGIAFAIPARNIYFHKSDRS